MESLNLFAIAPSLIVSVTILAVLVQVSISRSRQISFAITVTGLAVALILNWQFYPAKNEMVTMLFQVNPTSALFSLLAYISALSIAFFHHQYSSKFSEVQDEFYLLLLLVVLGALTLIQATHVASVLLGLELLSLSSIAMLAYNRDRQHSIEAAFKYLILSGVASAVLLFGVALLYLQSGSLQLVELVNFTVQNKLLYIVSMTLIVSGLGYKLSLVPFHWWTPDVYHGSPLSAGLTLATLSKIAAFAIVIKTIQAIPHNQAGSIEQLLVIIAISSMLLGNVLALMQRNLKRILAYSAVAHMGYVLVAAVVALKLNNNLIIEGSIYYLFAYVLASITLFAALICLSRIDNAEDCDDLDSIQGLFWKQPWLSSAMILALLSLSGMPITIGFIAKFYLLNLAIESNAVWLIATMVVASGIGVFFYLRWIFSLLKTTDKTTENNGQSELTLLNGFWLSCITGLLLILGVLPGLVGEILGTVIN